MTGLIDSLDYWRLCDALSIVQAALLLVGHDSGESAAYAETWQFTDRPKGYEAAKTAVAAALRMGAGAIKGRLVPYADRAIDGSLIRIIGESENVATARTRALTKLDAAQPATSEHSYLKRKGVSPCGIRMDGKGRLLVPVRNRRNELHSLQFIDAVGEKLFPKDGSVIGHYYVIGSPGDTVCIAG